MDRQPPTSISEISCLFSLENVVRCELEIKGDYTDSVHSKQDYAVVMLPLLPALSGISSGMDFAS